MFKAPLFQVLCRLTTRTEGLSRQDRGGSCEPVRTSQGKSVEIAVNFPKESFLVKKKISLSSYTEQFLNIFCYKKE